MNSKDEAERLFADNLHLAYFSANKFGRSFARPPDMGRDDAMQLCLVGLWTAACKFDDSRNVKFSTFACTCMYRQLLAESKKAGRQRPAGTVSIDAACAEPAGPEM
jgi:DNA-directed RNA polymerase specialized sigma subunit